MPDLKTKRKPSKRAKSKEFVLSAKEQRFLKKVGKLILNRLNKNDQSIESLSFELGISRSALYSILDGNSNFKILTIVSIAQGLGVKDISELLPKVD